MVGIASPRATVCVFVVLREALLLVDFLLVDFLRVLVPRRVLQPFFAAADLFALVIRPVDFFLVEALLVVFLVDLRDRAALLAALDLLVDFALRVLQPFFAAADREALVVLPLVVFLLVVFLLVVFLFLVAAAFFAAEERFDALRFLVAAAFLPAAERFAALRFLVAAAFFAAADREALLPPRRTDFLAVDFLAVFLAILVPFLLAGGFTNTSVPFAIKRWSLLYAYNESVVLSIAFDYIVIKCRCVNIIRQMALASSDG